MMIMQLLEIIPFQQLPCLPRVLIAKDSWQVNLLGRRLWQLTWPSGFAMMTNEITAGPGASVPGNHQEDDSSSWACNKLFQATNHQTGALFQNAQFLILFWRVNCVILVLGLFLIKNSKIAIQCKRIIIIPKIQWPKKRKKMKQMACLNAMWFYNIHTCKQIISDNFCWNYKT